MGILPCKLGCPLLPYMETMGSLVGSGVGCKWAAHGNLAMQIRPPTTSISEQSQMEGDCQWPMLCSRVKMHKQASKQLLQYTDTVGSSVGSPLLLSMKKVGGSASSSPLNCPLLNLKWRPSLIHMQDICSTCA